MKKKIVLITTMGILSFIPVSLFFPQTFLIFHLDRFEMSEECSELNGDWDWYYDICNRPSIESYNDQMCIDKGGIPSCVKCSTDLEYNLWNGVMSSGCLDLCLFACDFNK